VTVPAAVPSGVLAAARAAKAQVTLEAPLEGALATKPARDLMMVAEEQAGLWAETRGGAYRGTSGYGGAHNTHTGGGGGLDGGDGHSQAR
jgi:hypothetical protein